MAIASKDLDRARIARDKGRWPVCEEMKPDEVEKLPRPLPSFLSQQLSPFWANLLHKRMSAADALNFVAQVTKVACDRREDAITCERASVLYGSWLLQQASAEACGGGSEEE